MKSKKTHKNYHSTHFMHYIQLAILLLALVSLTYSTWRAEQNEINATARNATFEMLKALNELQLIVDYAHYDKNLERGNPITGWKQVLFIKDLSLFLDELNQQQAIQLLNIWQDNWNQVNQANAVTKITNEITTTKKQTLAYLKKLN